MSADIEISPLSEKTAPCVAKLEQELFSCPFSEADLMSYVSNEGWRLFVATQNERVLGYVSLVCVLDELSIANIATEPQSRRMGVASRLMEHIICFAKENGFTKIFLEVRESNVGAIALYKKFGFLPVGVSKNHYSQPRENAVLMNLEL